MNEINFTEHNIDIEWTKLILILIQVHLKSLIIRSAVFNTLTCNFGRGVEQLERKMATTKPIGFHCQVSFPRWRVEDITRMLIFFKSSSNSVFLPK